MGKRLEFIDAIKGFAILLVVMGHVIAWQYDNFDVDQITNNGMNIKALFWWELIYSFHMPLFFFVSGYLFPKSVSTLKEYAQIIWKKTYTLLLPFVVAAYLSYKFTGGGNYWFLKSLYIVILINLVGDYILGKLHRGLVSEVIYYIIVFIFLRVIVKILPETISEIIDFPHINSFNYTAFCLGTLVRKYNKISDILQGKNSYTIALLIFIGFTYLKMCGMLDHLFWLIPWTLIPLSGVVVIWNCFRTMNMDNGWCKALEYLGQHSLEIYILHFFFCIKTPMVGNYVNEMMSSGNRNLILSGITVQLLASFAEAAVNCMLCVVTFNLLRKSPLLSIALFGRKENI